MLYPSDATPPARSCGCGRSTSSPRVAARSRRAATSSQHGDIRTLADNVAIQLNDTHPAIAVAELMRILVDLQRNPLGRGLGHHPGAFSYTNHTLLPEALESWPVPLMERLLPRHMQIIYLINAVHLDVARRHGFGDPALLASISLIDENGGRRVRMGSLAFVGSHKINGVSASIPS